MNNDYELDQLRPSGWHKKKLDDLITALIFNNAALEAEVTRLRDTVAERDALIVAMQERADDMATSPDLLSACKKLIAYRDRNPRNWQIEKADDYFKLIRVAIAEAEQESD